MIEHGQFQKKLYGRRKGPKLSAHKDALHRTLLPKLALNIENGAGPRTYFRSSVDDVWLEIGFGAGEHLLSLARAHPGVGMIGAEPYEAGVCKLLSHLADDPPANLRLHEGDARDVLSALPDGSIERIFILFPDPWPKTRHHKRRFIQMEMLDTFARVLKPGGEWRFASDDAGYAMWALERGLNHPAFVWEADAPGDWNRRPAGWPQTRYEAKALHGPPVYLRFRRA